MLAKQELITSRVISTLNLFVLDEYEFKQTELFKKLVRKYNGVIKRDIEFSLKKRYPTFSDTSVLNLEPLDITDEDCLLFEVNPNELVKRLTIKAMTSYGVTGDKLIADYVAHIEFTIVKNIISSDFEKKKVWTTALFLRKFSKIVFKANRYGFKLFPTQIKRNDLNIL